MLLAELTQPIVIFIDEIDTVLSLSFSVDDFFTIIRDCYNQRADKPIYDRITFCLIGVATPSDLIQDKRRTPFNIGHAIALQGFQLHEAQPLLSGLQSKVENPEAVLQEIFKWTEGQPFLTQKICNLVCSATSKIRIKNESNEIHWLVKSRIIENWEIQDEPEHLRTIQGRILSRERITGHLLGIYQSILDQDGIEINRSYEQEELLLTGLATPRKEKLRVANPIYKSVFNIEWINLKFQNLRPYSESFDNWLLSDKNDTSRLLRGQALQDALNWASDKKMGTQDYQFLTASQRYERQQIEDKLNTQREYNRKLIKAQREAEKAQNQQEYYRVKSQNQQKSLFRLSIALLAGVSVALLGLIYLYQKATQQTKVLSFRANSSEIERLMGINPVNSLILSIASLGRSQEQQGVKRELHSVQRNLHLLLDQVRERRKFQIDGQKQGNFVLSVTFSPDGKMVASGHQDGTIRLWDLQGNPIGNPFIGHTDRVYAVAFSPDGKRIISGSWDTTLRRWDLQGNQLGPPFIGHTSWVTSVKFSPDGKRIISGSEDKTVRLWSWQGTPMGRPFIGHTAWVSSVAFSPDGETIVSGSKDGTVRLWDLEGNSIGEPFFSQSNGVVSVAFSPDGRSVVSGGDERTLKRSDLQGKAIASPFIGHDDSVMSVAFSPDGQSIASGSADGTIRLWDRQKN